MVEVNCGLGVGLAQWHLTPLERAGFGAADLKNRSVPQKNCRLATVLAEGVRIGLRDRQRGFNRLVPGPGPESFQRVTACSESEETDRCDI